MSLSSNPRYWRKSSLSANTANCVEVGRIGDHAAVRDSKNRTAGHLTLTPLQWSSFLTALKTGRYDT